MVCSGGAEAVDGRLAPIVVAAAACAAAADDASDLCPVDFNLGSLGNLCFFFSFGSLEDSLPCRKSGMQSKLYRFSDKYESTSYLTSLRSSCSP